MKKQKKRKIERTNSIKISGGFKGNFIGNAEKSNIKQRNFLNETNVPSRIGYVGNPITEWILNKVREKVASWISGMLSLLFGGVFTYLVNKQGFFPRDFVYLFPKPFPLLQFIFFTLTIIMVFLFFSIKNYKNKKKCPECNKFLNYIEYQDGEILAKSPCGAFKVKRSYKCPCGYKYERTRWEYPEKKRRMFS